jgi:hypothetical protein
MGEVSISIIISIHLPKLIDRNEFFWNGGVGGGGGGGLGAPGIKLKIEADCWLLQYF